MRRWHHHGQMGRSLLFIVSLCLAGCGPQATKAVPTMALTIRGSTVYVVQRQCGTPFYRSVELDAVIAGADPSSVVWKADDNRLVPDAAQLSDGLTAFANGYPLGSVDDLHQGSATEVGASLGPGLFQVRLPNMFGFGPRVRFHFSSLAPGYYLDPNGRHLSERKAADLGLCTKAPTTTFLGPYVTTTTS
jgi:hypothetical protein